MEAPRCTMVTISQAAEGEGSSFTGSGQQVGTRGKLERALQWMQPPVTSQPGRSMVRFAPQFVTQTVFPGLFSGVCGLSKESQMNMSMFTVQRSPREWGKDCFWQDLGPAGCMDTSKPKPAAASVAGKDDTKLD